ncbi:uncharacterized protein LOC120196530 [Hibiscus syriacus]|uniref:uncharacterized protein LOC120196530 n=1 Tax=Hibiscus syriacus TaxID=106335 RepID=UPI001920C642|nr:uncharacterized protein LOC120196530 [Hibiscus syriacus]
MIHSGVAGYVIEENISPDGLPVDGQRRLLCKRKAPKLGSSSAGKAQSSQQPRTIAQNNVSLLNAAANSFNDHSRLGAALPTSSNLYQIPSEARQVDNFQRNLWTWNSNNSNAQPTGQHPFTLTSSVPAPVLVNSPVQPTVQVSKSSQDLQHYWNGTSLSWVGPSSVSLDQTVKSKRNFATGREPRKQQKNNMMISLANVNLVNENANASSSRILAGSSKHLPNSSIGSPSPNMVATWTKRACRVHPSFSRRTEIQAHRRRLVSEEVYGAFGLVRMPGGVRLEEDPDILEDMRLDNMSYEELLELKEQIGDVCTGLSEETIIANMRRRKHQSITTEPPIETEPCCICQEDYADGEELGKLGCGHEFHFNCIKEWLVRKNSCPICKNPALAV